MSQTIAEMYIEKGRIEGKQEGKQEGALEKARSILLQLLRKRFKKVPRKVETRIAATTDIQELDTWIVNFANANSLAEVGIPTK